MAYSNVLVSNLNGLLDAIASFAGSNGWTVVTDGLTGGTRNITINYGGSTYITLVASSSGVYFNGHRGYSAGTSWNAQTDQFYNGGDVPTIALSRFTTTALTSVHLFAGTSPSPYIYAAVEISAGYYRHFWMGILEKAGSYNGGIFFDFTNIDDATNYVYSTYWERNRYPLLWNDTYQATPSKGGMDVEGLSGSLQWFGFANTGSYSRAGFFGSELTMILNNSPIPFTQNTEMGSVEVFGNTSGRYIPYGRAPNVRYLSMVNYNAGDEEVIGSDTWMIFPAIRKLNYRYSGGGYTHDPAYESSNLIGIAYKK